MISTLLSSMLVVGLAGADIDVVVKRVGSSTELSISGGQTFHRTRERVADLREIAVPGSQTTLFTWNEVGRGGAKPFYAISTDGRGMQRVTEGNVSINLKYAKFDPLVATPMVPADMQANPVNRMFIVQFETQPLDEFRNAIVAMGGEVCNYLPNNAYVVILPLGAESQVRALEYVRWVGSYQPAYRIEPEVITLLNRGELGIKDYYIQIANPSAQRKTQLATDIRKMGGRVIENPAEGSLMLVELTPSQVLGVAQLDGVLYFDRRTEVGNDGMVNVRSTSGANTIESVAGYTGQGVIAHVIDSGIRATHDAFDTPTNRLTVRTNSSSTSHGTSCSGIVFGNGTGNAAGRGMLPNANGVFTAYATNWAGRLAWTQATVNTFNAVVESNSWGDSLTGSYTTISAQMDEIIFNTDLLICQSMSNQGTNTGVRPQAWAKNIVAVGGIRHYGTLSLTDDRWANGASVGPAADGRIKPDLSFFYDSITTTSNGSDTSYTTSFGGTSAATPQTAGTFGIFFQMWSNGIFGNPSMGSSVFANRPKSTLARAFMINNGRQYVPGANGNDITRMRQGWGLPWLEPIFDNRDDVFFINERDALTNLQTRSYKIFVPNGTPLLKSTMIYMDLAAAASANPTRVNDLNLRVTSPSNVVYHGNVGLASGPWSSPGGSPDGLNPVENIFVQNPQAGVWTIEVIGANINTDARPETPGVIDADFALVVTGGDAQAPMTNFSVGDGAAFSGNLESLHRSDNQGVTIFQPTTAEFVDDRRVLFADTTVATTTSSEFRIGFEARANTSTTAIAQVAMLNHATNQWENVSTGLAIGASDSTHDIVVPNGSRFINAARLVRTRVTFRNFSTSTSTVWSPIIDQLRITQFQP